MTDYLLEKRLQKTSPELHRMTMDCVLVLQKMLESYHPRFPTFTDHTALHSLDVLDYSNRILGEQVNLLTPNECYVLYNGVLSA